MNSLYRLIGILTLVATVAWAEPLVAQISIGGFNSGGNQNNDDDEEEDNNNNNNNQNSNRQGNQRSDSNNATGGNSSSQKLQKYLQSQGLQGQGGIPGQGQGEGQNNNSNQFRRSQQGQNQQGQFQNNPNFQNWQQNNQNGITLGTWQGGKWNGSRKIQNWTQNFGGGDQPFSSQWYQDHPKAWKYDNNKADVWVVASMPGIYGWLGWGNVPQQYNVNYGNVPQQYNFNDYGDWYPLGVFSLMSGPGDMGTRIVQLAVDRHGHIAGNYYDMITNSNYSVSGDISQQSQRVSWSLNKNQAIRFRAHISQLLQPYGTITVRMPGGEQQWQFVRLED